jgi:hypothetical protein
MWVFAQATGRMWHLGAAGKSMLEIGYAGRGRGENNPNLPSADDNGPLPLGRYRLREAPVWCNMSHCFHLEPEAGTELAGRSGFLIHAGLRDAAAGASAGSIVLSFEARAKIAASDCRELVVQRDDP